MRISGYGQTGPYRDRPGFGAIGEAMGGLRYTTGSPDSPPARVGVSLGDSLASLHGVIGALMSLLRVKTGQGEGQIVDVSLSRACSTDGKPGPGIRPDGPCAQPQRRRLAGHRPSNTYPTADDGYVVIAGNSDAIFKRLMAAVGRADLADAIRRSPPTTAASPASQELDAAITAWTPAHAWTRCWRRWKPPKCRPAGSIRWPTSSRTRITWPAT